MSNNNGGIHSHYQRLTNHQKHDHDDDESDRINMNRKEAIATKNIKLFLSSIALLILMGTIYPSSNTESFKRRTNGDGHHSLSPHVKTPFHSQHPSPQSNTPWPLPYRVSIGKDTICLNPHLFTFAMGKDSACQSSSNTGKLEEGGEMTTTTTQSCQDLYEAFDRYKSLIFDHTVPSSSTSYLNCVASASILVENGDSILDYNVDESYSLNVTSKENDSKEEGSTIQIKAFTAYGAMRALETLSQLVQFNFTTKSFIIKNAPWTIQDKPQYPHRELLIDTSRHFLPLSTIRTVISSLPYAKINVLHWHLVDDQNFPYCSEIYPEFCSKSMYSSFEHYTKEDIIDIVSFARKHAVRIVMEVDIPGHTSSWCHAIPDICTANGDILSPANNPKKTKQVISDILREIANLVPDTFFHLGGDEVNTSLWDNDDYTVAYMKEHNISISKDIYLDFVRFAHETILNLGKVPIGWGEIWSNFGDSLDKRSILQKWVGNSQNLTNMIVHGYRVINVDSSRNYLDHLDTTWKEMYSFEMCSADDDATNRMNNLCDKLVIGGGGEMWGETVDTSDVLSTVWPKLGAIAERLWSPKRITDALRKDDDTMEEMIQPRLAAFRCLLNRRGIAATPLNSRSREAPIGPDSCYRQ